MKLNRIAGQAVLLAVLALSVGCSGINASHGVSPATFLIPGLMSRPDPSRPDPSQPVVPSVEQPAEPSALLAQVN